MGNYTEQDHMRPPMYVVRQMNCPEKGIDQLNHGFGHAQCTLYFQNIHHINIYIYIMHLKNETMQRSQTHVFRAFLSEDESRCACRQNAAHKAHRDRRREYSTASPPYSQHAATH